MNAKTLAIAVLFLCFAPLAADACPSGRPDSLAYIRRDNNRCEGIREPTVSAGLRLISFSTSALELITPQEYPDTIALRIPTANTPQISLQSFHRSYLLDGLETESTPTGATFALDTAVLKRAEIPPQTLHAIAFTTADATPVYYPVILDRPSDRYQFLVFSPQRRVFPNVAIRRHSDGEVIWQEDPPRQIDRTFVKVIIEFSDLPEPGTYELYLEDENGSDRTFVFQHDPAWYESPSNRDRQPDN